MYLRLQFVWFRSVSDCWANHMVSTTCTNPQFLVQMSNLVAFRIESRNIRQYPKLFLSDDYNPAVLPNQLCPVPLINPVPPTLTGSWLRPIFRRALVFYWRYILSDLLLPYRAPFLYLISVQVNTYSVFIHYTKAAVKNLEPSAPRAL